MLVTPPVVMAGIGGVFSRRWAKRWLPLTAGISAANGLLARVENSTTPHTRTARSSGQPGTPGWSPERLPRWTRPGRAVRN